MWLVAAVRLGLWLLPFQYFRRFLASSSKSPLQPIVVDQVLVSRVAWAVTVSSRYIPRATCLTQALSTKILLNRRGQPTALRIGVTRSERGELLAHAWVEIEGQSVIGGSDSFVKRYTTLPLLGEEII
jgi:hypothetical protein